jgi:hypothetical protein
MNLNCDFRVRNGIYFHFDGKVKVVTIFRKETLNCVIFLTYFTNCRVFRSLFIETIDKNKCWNTSFYMIERKQEQRLKVLQRGGFE